MSHALPLVVLLSLLLFCAGCGASSTPTEFPRAAEPADSPPLRQAPAGTVAKVGAMPEGLAFDAAAGLLAVGLRAPNQLAFVDPDSLAVVRRVALPAAPRHLSLSPTGTAVVVPAEAANAVFEVSPGAGIVSRTAVGNHPHDATSTAKAVFVADEHSDQVSVVEDGRVIASLGTPVQPGGIAASADGRYVALVAVAERVLQVYDGREPRRLGATSGGVGPTHVVTFGEDAFVADTQGGRVRRYRLGPRPRQTASLPAPGAPYGLAVDRRRKRLWVTLTASNRLLEFNLAGAAPRQIASYPTVRQPNSVEVEPRSGDVFLAGNAAGVIERIVPGRDAG
jgi:DNA-binding beta-propeller fold protein YncE